MERSEENPLSNKLTKKVIQQADEKGAWRIFDLDHAVIIETDQDMSYLEYDEDLVEEFCDELVTELAWANNGGVNGGSDEEQTYSKYLCENIL